MPKRRVQVDSGLRAPTPEVTTRKSDTHLPFTGTAAKGQLEQLGRGLSAFSRTLDQIYGAESKRTQESDLEKGKQAFFDARDSQKEWKELQKNGAPPEMNPWRRMGWQLAAGGNAAMRYEADLTVAADEALSEATSIDEVRDFEAKFRAEWEATNVGDAATEAFNNGYQPSVEAAIGKFNREWASKVTSQFLQAEKDAIGAEVTSKLRSALEDPNVEWSDLSEGIAGVADLHYGNGVTKATDYVVDAIISFAVTEESLESLQVLKGMQTGPHPKTGKRQTVLDVPRYREAVETAERAVASQRTQRRTDAEKDREYRNEESYRKIEAESLDSLMALRDAPWSFDEKGAEAKLRESGLGQSYIDKHRSMVADWKNASVDGDESAAEGYYRQIGLVGDVSDAMILSDPRLNRTQMGQLITAARVAREKNSGKGDPFMSDIERDLRLVYRPEVPHEKADKNAALAGAFSTAALDWNRWRYGTEEGRGTTDFRVLEEKRRSITRQAIQNHWPEGMEADLPDVLDAFDKGTFVLAGQDKDPTKDVMISREESVLWTEQVRLFNQQKVDDLPPGLVRWMDQIGANLEDLPILLTYQRNLNGVEPAPRR